MVTEFTVAVTGWSAPTGGPVQLAGCGVCPGILHGSTAAAELELDERAVRARMNRRPGAPFERRLAVRRRGKYRSARSYGRELWGAFHLPFVNT